MWQEIKGGLMLAAAFAVAALLAVAGALLRLGRRLLVAALKVLVGLILLFEEWGWRPLMAAVAWLARFRLWARAELLIAGLPPYGALVAFLLPMTLLFPLKVAALWLLAQGYALWATALLAAAKVASTAFIARIFMLTKPALMRIGWFARLYNWYVPWRDALFSEIRASWAWRYGRFVKESVRHEAQQAWQAWRPDAVELWTRLETAARRLWADWRRRLYAMGLQVRADVERFLRRPRA